MGKAEKPNIFIEIGALLNWQESAKLKDRWGEDDDIRTGYYIDYLLKNEPTFANRFTDKNVSIQRLGRGWHNMAYRMGDMVVKIPHSDGPVPGFNYPPTAEGAELANSHLQTLRGSAIRHNLPHLIGEDERVYFVPGHEESHIPGEIVSVQKFFDPLVAAKDFHTLHPSIEDRQRLVDEFRSFVDMFWDARNNHGLRIDNFGYSNLAISYGKDGLLHFVLSDNQPADSETAGEITKLGLDVMIGKEIVMWSVALGVGHSLRRLILQRNI